MYKPEVSMDMLLRQRAEEQLKQGSAPITRGWPTGTEALALLHRLASRAETASDALKLLHELQVHQVELDLQHEQAEQEYRQLTEDLANYAALFDLAPFAYLSLNPEGQVIAANHIAADWLSSGPGEAQECVGRRVEDLLAPGCRVAVRAMLAALRKGEGRQTLTVLSSADGSSAHAMARAAQGGEQVLMAFVPAGP
ncbi:MAG: PAS domain-containing protein [Burkholderiaceae bacterium]